MDYSPPGSVMGFSRQEHWSGWPFPSSGNLREPGSLALQADSLPSEPPEKTPGSQFAHVKARWLDCISKSHSECAYQSPGDFAKMQTCIQ